MKREYHLLVDYGADLIVNHHQHCFSGFEEYNGTPIFYGLGNFYFDNPNMRNDKWNEGLLLQVELKKNSINYNLIPYWQCRTEPVIAIRDYNEVNGTIEQLNAIIKDDKLLNEHFNRLLKTKKPLYPFLPYGNHYLRALYSRGLLPDFMSYKRKSKILNAVRCETHREIILSYFEAFNE